MFFVEQSSHVETVVKLSFKTDTPRFEVIMEPGEEHYYLPKEKATYQKIKEYVKNKYGVNVHTSYIAQCPPEKVEYIKDALAHFKLINV